MINLLDVNTYASMIEEKVSSEDLAGCQEILKRIEERLADRREVLSALERKAEESGSDNSWNRYESADEAYGYGEQLKNLIEDLIYGESDREDIEWQVGDIISSTGREFAYRLERAQW